MNYMPFKFKYCLTVFLVCLSSFMYAEGTKQLCPVYTDYGYLQINDKGRSSATYGATADERIYIHISSATKERIYYGFGRVTDGSTARTDVWYRIKNPQGVVVVGPTRITNSGYGYISGYNRCVEGPGKISTSGYPALVYDPVDTGDYWIEFNQGSGTVYTPGNTNKRIFETFDITVIDTTVSPVINGVKNGRVWSRNWDITTNGGSNKFAGTLYVYSNDRVVTSINFNGIQPHAFRIACNSTGCVDNNTPIEDRKSRDGDHTYPSYKIFFNDPDHIAYPSGVIGTLTADLTISGCAPNYCINATTGASGYIEFVVDLNGVAGYQAGTKDLLFGQFINVGTTCIPWDGKDGLGNAIPQNLNFQIQADYKYGLTNLPIFDVEDFSGGFKVSSVRPSVIKPKLFWDDSNISGGTTNLTGCTNGTGCHPWPSANFGDDRTINTWWYVNTQKDTISVTTATKPSPNIAGTGNFCDTTTNTVFQTPLIGGNLYVWSIKRGTIVSGGNTHSVTVKRRMGIDTLIVKEINSSGCYEDTLYINSSPSPTPVISGDTTGFCEVPVATEVYSTPNVPGHTYSWSITGGTIQSGSNNHNVTVKWTVAGTGVISVTEGNASCSKTVSKNVAVSPKPVTSNITH
jgi:hypothetical protein